MIRTLNPYPAYKPSGVPWLGQVPVHWEVRRLKYWLHMNLRVLPENTSWAFEFLYIDIGSVGTGRLLNAPQPMKFGDAPSRARRIVQKGDTIVSTVRTYLKAVYFANDEYPNLIASTGFAVLTPKEGTAPKFVSYLVQSDGFTNRVAAESVGIAYPAIAENRLASLEVAIPPLPEQTAIVRFLDYVDRRIRRYMRAKQKLIKLLEEYKQALIHEVVTGKSEVRRVKGEDGSERLERMPRSKDQMKPSGVLWLGEVPEHWEVLPGRAVFREINDRGHPDEEMLSVTITRGVLRQAELLADSSKKDSSNEDKSNYKLVQPGDLVYNKMRAWQGAVGVSAYRGIVSPAYIVQRLRSAENLPRYMHFLLRTPLFASEAERWSYGITSDQWSLRAEEFRCIYFPLPPLPEQTAIVEYLDTQTAKIDAAIATARREIELLREYRERLIADVVTGKVDVREVAARLPEETEEMEDDQPEETDEASETVINDEEEITNG